MTKRSIKTLPLDGGWLCLNYVNTVHDRTVEEPFEYLSDYSNLLEWSVKLELLSLSEREELDLIARNDRERAESVLQQLLKARKILYDLFLAISEKRGPDRKTQDRFNDLLKKGMVHLDLRVEDNLEIHQQWDSKSDLMFPIYPITKSAYDLLTSDQLDRVKECGACGWLFLDQSKNKSRKWCSMENCGSNVKAKRYYHRHKDD